jgi:tRNA-splicing ligase RtcB
MLETNAKLEKLDDFRWRLPIEYKTGMKVPGIIFTEEKLLEMLLHDQALEQVANVAMLPGIVKASLAMPDIHWGYGFPIGGVAATRVDNGVISPGGVGFDINCGVRLLRTNLTFEEIKPVLESLMDKLFALVPTGVGSSSKVKLTYEEMKKVMTQGAEWGVQNHYGWDEDLRHLEEKGALSWANPDMVSKEAVNRGKDQLGTLGSGNHFLEIQVVEKIEDKKTAEAVGIFEGQTVILIHTGSRGFGHQIATDYIAAMGKALQKYGIDLPDRQLACAPVESPEGKSYYGAMAAAANFAFANRQLITQWTREAFEKVFKKKAEELGIKVVYDVAHNMAKIEEHEVDGEKIKVCVHRKGAVRAFPPGHPDLPPEYKEVGQPVPVPGDMGRYSYLLRGGPEAMVQTFGTTCHGAGRQKSRSQAKREVKYDELMEQMADLGIIVRASSRGTVVEEAPMAYKDVRDVVDVTHGAGISLKVARMKPLGVLKG